jgi:rubrerythrin
MDRTELDAIIDFAVERERKAAEFYRELQSVVRFRHMKDVLASFEAVERSHIDILKRLRKKSPRSFHPVPDAVSLGLADKLVPAPPTAEMSYEDVLILAMRREKEAQEFYGALADAAISPETKAVFAALAAQEAEHKVQFELKYDDLRKDG